MKQKIIVLSLLFLGLMFSGCDTDSKGQESLKTQQMWDDNDYDGIISSLESKSSRTSEENMRLGNAYMNAADLSFTDLALLISDSSSKAAIRNLNQEFSGASYTVFAQKIEQRVQNNPEVLNNLSKAIESFIQVDDNTSQDENNISISTLIGAAQTAQATSAFSYLGNISQLFENGIDYELLASSCAIYHVYGYRDVELLSNPLEGCLQSVIIADTNNSVNYKEMLVSLSNGNTYKRLLTFNMQNIILTDGYIDVNGEFTYDSNNGMNTPKMIEDESLTLEDALVMSLNDGFSNITSILDEDIRDEVVIFRDEMDQNLDGTISEIELSEFIHLQIRN